MVIYWLLLAYFAVGSLFAKIYPPPYSPPRPMFAVGAIIVASIIGFRYRVGADWISYRNIFIDSRRSDLFESLGGGDPGYQALNWVVSHSGGDFWLVNVLSATVFTWGLFRFCAIQPDRWTAALMAVPYLIIVVAMGYTRQAVALGLLMAGLASFLRGGSAIRFAAYVTFAALFHRTAVVIFPLVVLATGRNRAVNLLIAISLAVLLYDLFLSDAVQGFIESYISTAYSSQGAAIRVAMNLSAVVVFWMLRDRLNFNGLEYRLWRNFSFATLALLFMLVILPSSTAVDRISLYILPIQIAVLSRISFLFRTRFAGLLLILLYTFAVQLVWLNFAYHAEYWVPFRFYRI